MIQNVENIEAEYDNHEDVDRPVTELDDAPIVGQEKTGHGTDSHEYRQGRIALSQSQHQRGEKSQQTECRCKG